MKSSRILFPLLLLCNLSLSQTNVWEEKAAPFGGNISALAINSSGHIFAGTTAGVHRSTNNGGSWSSIGLMNSDVRSLALNSNGHIFAGSGGVFRSTDNGSTWTNSSFPNTFISSLAINSNGHIFAADFNPGNIYRSTDNGTSWISVKSDSIGIGIWCFAINSSSHIFAGGNKGVVYRSTDNGASWTQVKAPVTNPYAYTFGLGVNSKGHIFAAIADDGIYSSTDNGTNWTQVGLAKIQLGVLVVNSIDYIYVAAKGNRFPQYDGVYRSTDNGGSWKQINGGLSHTYIQSLAINPNGYLFAGAGTNFFRTIKSTLVPFTPILSTPEQGAINQPTTVTLRWNISPRTTTYWLQLATDSTFLANIPVNDSTIIDTFKVLTGLTVNTTYYWRVSAKNNFGTSDWSAVYNFKTTMSTFVVPISQHTPTQYLLSQCYPNPFNPTTTIEFTIPRSTFVSLTIYSSLGIQIANLVNHNLAVGTYRIRWLADGLPSGTYFYQLRTPEFADTKKLILLR